MPYVDCHWGCTGAPERPKVGHPRRDRTKIKAARKARHRA